MRHARRQRRPWRILVGAFGGLEAHNGVDARRAPGNVLLEALGLRGGQRLLYPTDEQRIRRTISLGILGLVRPPSSCCRGVTGRAQEQRLRVEVAVVGRSHRGPKRREGVGRGLSCLACGRDMLGVHEHRATALLAEAGERVRLTAANPTRGDICRDGHEGQDSATSPIGRRSPAGVLRILSLVLAGTRLGVERARYQSTGRRASGARRRHFSGSSVSNRRSASVGSGCHGFRRPAKRAAGRGSSPADACASASP